jgi:hypothetical protein
MRWPLIAVAVIWGTSLVILSLTMAGRLINKRIRRMIDGD